MDPDNQRYKPESVGIAKPAYSGVPQAQPPSDFHFDENEPAKYTCDKCDESF